MDGEKQLNAADLQALCNALFVARLGGSGVPVRFCRENGPVTAMFRQGFAIAP
jgi:hypothetical protein